MIIERAKTDYVPRSAWIPEVSNDESIRERSKYFGSPVLHRQETWPEILGRPSRFVLQLDVSQLPSLYRKLLGGRGVIQFFYHPSSSTSENPQVMGMVRRVNPNTKDGATPINQKAM